MWISSDAPRNNCKTTSLRLLSSRWWETLVGITPVHENVILIRYTYIYTYIYKERERYIHVYTHTCVCARACERACVRVCLSTFRCHLPIQTSAPATNLSGFQVEARRVQAEPGQGVGFSTRELLRRLDHGSHGRVGLHADAVCRGLGPTAVHSESGSSATCSTSVRALRWFRFRVAQICGDSRPI